MFKMRCLLKRKQLNGKFLISFRKARTETSENESNHLISLPQCILLFG